MSSTGKFIRAIAAGTTGLVRLQVARSPALVFATDAVGNSALHIAIRRQRYDIASFLCKQGAKMSLQSAAALGDVALVLDRLRQHPSLVSRRTADGWTATHLACYYGHPKVLAVLIAYGADINATGPTGFGTPLHMAAAGGHAAIIQLLLRHGASLDDQDSAGFNALEISLLTANDNAYSVLLEETARRRRGDHALTDSLSC